jgi:glycosyltransferase involved in cell wall biosynthesis
MKILLVHNTYQFPGGEDVVYQRERDLLVAHGDEVVEYLRSNKEIEEYSLVQHLKLAPGVVWSSESRREFSELLRRTKPDLVHVHNTFMVISPSIYGACREQGVPVVQTLHNYRLLCPAATFFRDGKPCHDCTGHLGYSVLHACYRGSRARTATVATMLAWHRAAGTYSTLVDRYIALTKFSRDNFLAAGFDPGKMTVKPNFVPADPGERRGDGSYAAFVGRIESEKGLRTLLSAWRQLPRAVPLRLAGTGPLVEELRSAAVSMGPHVQYLGQLRPEQIMDLLKGARFLVFPTELYENFPLTLAEAYACGLPVVGSDTGATKEIVRHDSTGLLFRRGDASDLAAKVTFAWNNPDQMKRMGKQARKEYEDKYTAERNYHLLKAVYNSVLPGGIQASVAAETSDYEQAVPVS